MAKFKISEDVRLKNFPGMPTASIVDIVKGTENTECPRYLVNMIHQGRHMQFNVKEYEIVSINELEEEDNIKILPPQIIDGDSNTDVYKRARISTCMGTNLTPVPVVEVVITWSGDTVTTVLNDILARCVPSGDITECEYILTADYAKMTNYKDGQISFNLKRKCESLEEKVWRLFRATHMFKARMAGEAYIKEKLGEEKQCTEKDALHILRLAYEEHVADAMDDQAEEIWECSAAECINLENYKGPTEQDWEVKQ